MGKNVALAVVDNPKGAIVLDASKGGDLTSDGVTPSMVRDFIEKDLARYPELRTKAASIEEVVVVSDESISSGNYAQDLMQCYVRRMRSGGWDSPKGLHIFETFLGSVRVYIAYGI